MCNGEKKALNKSVTYTVQLCTLSQKEVTCVTENIIMYLQQKTAVCVSEKRKRRTNGLQ